MANKVHATPTTLASERWARLRAAEARGVEVVEQACPGLAECVEAGDLEGPHTRTLLDRFLSPMAGAGVDTVVLGCTHYPFLAEAIGRRLPEGVALVSSGEAVARQTAARVAKGPGAPGAVTCHCNRSDDAYAAVLARLWGAALPVEPLPVPAALSPDDAPS